MKVLFFPEGKRHSGNTLIPFKKGPFHLAITSQVPILPVIVSKYFFLNSKSKRFGSGMVIFLSSLFLNISLLEYRSFVSVIFNRMI